MSTHNICFVEKKKRKIQAYFIEKKKKHLIWSYVRCLIIKGKYCMWMNENKVSLTLKCLLEVNRHTSKRDHCPESICLPSQSRATLNVFAPILSLTLVLLNLDMLCKQCRYRSVLASGEGNWFGSTLFDIKNVTLYQEPASSNRIG